MKTKEFLVFPRAFVVSLDWLLSVFLPGTGICSWNWDLSLELGSPFGTGISPRNWDLSLAASALGLSSSSRSSLSLGLESLGILRHGGKRGRPANSLTQEWEFQRMFRGFTSTRAIPSHSQPFPVGIWDSKGIICWESHGTQRWCQESHPFLLEPRSLESPAGSRHIQVLFPVKRNSQPQLLPFILPPTLVGFSLPKTPPIPIPCCRNHGKTEKRGKTPMQLHPPKHWNVANSNPCSLEEFHIPGGGNSFTQLPSPRRESSWSVQDGIISPNSPSRNIKTSLRIPGNLLCSGKWGAGLGERGSALAGLGFLSLEPNPRFPGAWVGEGIPPGFLRSWERFFLEYFLLLNPRFPGAWMGEGISHGLLRS